MNIYYCWPQGNFKALTMSYDDGKVQDRRLVEIFNRYGIKGTFNLNYGFLGRDGWISPQEVRSLYRGHEVATHTYDHPSISRCPLTLVAQEILEDRKGLEKLTGTVVRGHAYPNGSYTKEIEELFTNLGIAYGRVVETVPDFSLPENPMEWHGTCHHGDPKLLEYGKYFTDLSQGKFLKLMYVWGHSYEFDYNTETSSWERIEDFCSLMGKRSDIWYATNIEIIDYLSLLHGLRFTADSDAVYNPAAASAWLLVNDNVVEAKGGCLTAF